MGIKIIIGGPPNSGKSTLAESLARALQEQGIDAEAVDLDPWSPTLDYVKRKITLKERNSLKRKKLSTEEINDVVKRFEKASKYHEVIIGDAPGGISEQTKRIYRTASHGIIVCREDKKEELDNWEEFFTEIELDLIAIVISKMDGKEETHFNDLIKAILVRLDRQPHVTPIVRLFTIYLRTKLGI